MSKREPYLLIDDIIESAKKILAYTEHYSYDDFIKDDRTIDAVIRNFEVIGEAANRLPEGFKEQFSQINWHQIRGFRNRIVHHYFGIDYSILWEIRTNYLPRLIKMLEEI